MNGCRVALCGVHLRVFTESRVSTLESVWVANGFCASPFRAGGGGVGVPVAGLSISRPTHSAGLDATLPPLPLSSPPRSQPTPSTVSSGAALHIVKGLWHRPGFTSISWQCTLSLCSQEMIKVQPVFLLIYLISKAKKKNCIFVGACKQMAKYIFWRPTKRGET